MNEHIERLKHDFQTIQMALGLDIWTRKDVRRGFLGVLGGSVASLFLAVWLFCGGDPPAGLLIYLILLQAIVVLKAVGYGKNPAPSPGTQREVAFYNRFYFVGAAVIGCYFFWGQRQGIAMPALFASTVVIVGMWYLFYAISSPSRALSVAGAVPLIVGGFVLPEAKDISQMFGWLGIVACLGCGFEAALLFGAIRQSGGAGSPPAPAPTPVPGPPEAPVLSHAAH